MDRQHPPKPAAHTRLAGVACCHLKLSLSSVTLSATRRLFSLAPGGSCASMLGVSPCLCPRLSMLTDVMSECPLYPLERPYHSVRWKSAVSGHSHVSTAKVMRTGVCGPFLTPGWPRTPCLHPGTGVLGRNHRAPEGQPLCHHRPSPTTCSHLSLINTTNPLQR